MTITILNDNLAGKCQSEHGLSYLIQADETILFDAAATDLFRKNAHQLGIDLAKVSTLVLSHGHWDHGNGLQYLSGKTLVAHPNVFMQRYRRKNRSYIGLILNKEQVEQRFKCIYSRTPYKIGKQITFLGQVPRLNKFEAQETPFIDAEGNDDFVIDDSALAITTPKGLIVVSGCAHAGICNTVEYARKVTGQQKVHAVLGGFHLKHNNEQTQLTIDYFKQLEVDVMYPSHCTELPALAQFFTAFGSKQLKSGDELMFH